VRRARAIVALAARAEDSADQAAIGAALLQWIQDFNAQRADKVCELFETDVMADIRETESPQTFDLVCQRLKRAVGNQTRTYSYSPDIKEILVGLIKKATFPGGSFLGTRSNWIETVGRKAGIATTSGVFLYGLAGAPWLNTELNVKFAAQLVA